HGKDENHFLVQATHFASNYFTTSLSQYIRIFCIAGVFLFISGICVNFSHNNYKRGFRLLTISLLLSLISWMISLVMNNGSFIIYFGILHCLAIAMLLSEPMKKLPKPLVFVLAVLMLGVGLYLEKNKINSHFLFIPFNITPKGFITADYYPILPYGAFYLFGYLVGGRLYQDKTSLFRKERNIVPFNFLGKTALWFYLIHQIFLFLFLYLVGLILL
ncbi:MAG: DUF1624 domain-containing protein, partial [Bacilli bacterium]|nr:DUF1624 domain-containing protein [Bacilli bacterium]